MRRKRGALGCDIEKGGEAEARARQTEMNAFEIAVVIGFGLIALMLYAVATAIEKLTAQIAHSAERLRDKN